MATQNQIAEFLGISQMHVSRILAGQPFGRKAAQRIAARINNGVAWNELLIMDPAEIRKQLEEAIRNEPGHNRNHRRAARA